MEYIIDLKDCKDKAAMHAAIRTAMGWPDCYGCNWDAFHDMLGETIRPGDTLCILGDISQTPMEKILKRLKIEYTVK